MKELSHQSSINKKSSKLNFERDLYIYKLHIEGHTDKQIADKVEEHFIKTDMEEKIVNKYLLNPSAVNKIIERMKKKSTSFRGPKK